MNRAKTAWFKPRISRDVYLIGKKSDLDLAGVTQSFLDAIAIQEARLDMVAQAIKQVEAICP